MAGQCVHKQIKQWESISSDRTPILGIRGHEEQHKKMKHKKHKDKVAQTQRFCWLLSLNIAGVSGKGKEKREIRCSGGWPLTTRFLPNVATAVVVGGVSVIFGCIPSFLCSRPYDRVIHCVFCTFCIFRGPVRRARPSRFDRWSLVTLPTLQMRSL